MTNCSKHKKEIEGITDMTLLAEKIGDLHYETLGELLFQLSKKIYQDGVKDEKAGRIKLGTALKSAAFSLHMSNNGIHHAWMISKPFMSDTE